MLARGKIEIVPEIRRSMNTGEKVFVSVASDATNSLMTGSLSDRPIGGAMITATRRGRTQGRAARPSARGTGMGRCGSGTVCPMSVSLRMDIDALTTGSCR